MSELYKISELFGQSAYREFMGKRFGLKGCQNLVDYEMAGDLMYILKRTQERVEECCLSESTCTCTLEQIKERINTL